MLSAFIKKHNLPERFVLTAERYHKPFAKRILSQFSQNDMPLFVGINGCQGSGKSTLTDFIAQYLTTQYQLNVVVMSLDDFYLSSRKRKELAEFIHPLLATRGVPGTHDIIQLNEVLSQLKQQKTHFCIPKFNKATDEPFTKSEWPLVEAPADIIILEGWCWGIKPQTADQLKTPINELESQYDKTGKWRHYVNKQLSENYQPLYEKMDFWLVLQAPSFEHVYKWRLEQEQKLQNKHINLVNSKIMTQTEINHFIQHFQRLSTQGLKTSSQFADIIFYLDNDRNIKEIFYPALFVLDS